MTCPLCGLTEKEHWSWNDKNCRAVRGHLCDGLAKFQEAGRGCSPAISYQGEVVGCDDSNPVNITRCPFCGWEFTQFYPQDVKEKGT